MSTVYFARQPIFDRASALRGYELLYRPAPNATRAAGEEDEMASSVLADAVLAAGLDTASGGVPAFLNLSRTLFLNGPADLLDPAAVVLELLESVPPDGEVVARCQALTRHGFRLALDDYVPGDPRARLLPFVQIVKVDVLGMEPHRVVEFARSISPRPTLLLAEKVEDREMQDACLEAGFDLFQGYFYERPRVVLSPDLSPGASAILDLLRLLRDPGSSDEVIVAAFKKDPALSFKLIRMANSAGVGGRAIDSLQHALRLLGRAPLYRWLALLFASSVRGRTGIDETLFHEALVAARFAELLAPSEGGSQAQALHFLVGLLSRIAPLLSTDVPTLLGHVRLSADAEAALLKGEGPAGRALDAVESWRKGLFGPALEAARELGHAPDRLFGISDAAERWAREQETMLGRVA